MLNGAAVVHERLSVSIQHATDEGTQWLNEVVPMWRVRERERFDGLDLLFSGES